MLLTTKSQNTRRKNSELKIGIDNSTRVVADFKTPLSVMGETARGDKELEDLNNAVNQLSRTEIYRACHSNTIRILVLLKCCCSC